MSTGKVHPVPIMRTCCFEEMGAFAVARGNALPRFEDRLSMPSHTPRLPVAPFRDNLMNTPLRLLDSQKESVAIEQKKHKRLVYFSLTDAIPQSEVTDPVAQITDRSKTIAKARFYAHDQISKLMQAQPLVLWPQVKSSVRSRWESESAVINEGGNKPHIRVSELTARLADCEEGQGDDQMADVPQDESAQEEPPPEVLF